MINLVINFLEKTIWSKYPSFKQFVKYAFVGVLNTITDFLVYVVLTRAVYWFAHYYLVANMFSFVIAVTQSFFLNKFWTFQDKEKNHASFQYIKFVFINFITLAVNQLIFYLLVDRLNVYDLFAKIVLIFSSVMINFALMKYWVFKK